MAILATAAAAAATAAAAAAVATAAATVRMLIYEELKGGHTDSTQLPFPVKMM